MTVDGVSLRDYLEEVVRRIDERHRTFELQAAETKQAANEWRGALQDRERATVSRNEFDAKIGALEAKTDQASATNAALLAALGVEMRAGFESLKLTRAASEAGRDATRRTAADLRVWLLGAATFVATVLAAVSTVVAMTRG